MAPLCGILLKGQCVVALTVYFYKTLRVRFCVNYAVIKIELSLAEKSSFSYDMPLFIAYTLNIYFDNTAYKLEIFHMLQKHVYRIS